ncbi:MAG TPA: helix-turn-helix domain-containing protein [Candidatus Acidoferrum sp.]|nr:helix-turn-helix domain-containing protein [Candidatus Acidoferrum sp.]
MIIGERLSELREQKKLSQREIESRSGLQRAYLSRVENGHTVPTIETLEKWANALEVPLYQLFYDGPEPLKPSSLRVWKSPDEAAWGQSGKNAEYLRQLRRSLRKLDEPNRRLLLQMASRLARRAQKSGNEEE